MTLSVTPNRPHLQWDNRNSSPNRHERRKAVVAKSESPFIRCPDGSKLFYADIATRIRNENPGMIGAHISDQLEALGLLDAMRKGSTPFPLPYSFN
jgi:hypothetical protein